MIFFMSMTYLRNCHGRHQRAIKNFLPKAWKTRKMRLLMILITSLQIGGQGKAILSWLVCLLDGTPLTPWEGTLLSACGYLPPPNLAFHSLFSMFDQQPQIKFPHFWSGAASADLGGGSHIMAWVSQYHWKTCEGLWHFLMKPQFIKYLWSIFSLSRYIII